MASPEPPARTDPPATLADVVDAYRRLGVRLEPPLDASARAALTAQLSAELPPDLAALGALTGGMRGWATDFSLRLEAAGGPSPFARVADVPPLGRCLEIGSDGFGNRYLVEPRRDRSPVWFLAHHPDLLVLAARSLREHLARRLPYVAAITEIEEAHHGEGEHPPSPDHDPRLLAPQPADDGDGQVFDFGSARLGDGLDLTRYPLAQLARRADPDVFVWRPGPAPARKPWWRLW